MSPLSTGIQAKSRNLRPCVSDYITRLIHIHDLAWGGPAGGTLVDMKDPAILIELQSVHDLLATIERDLTAYPPDMAALAQERAALDKRLAAAAKALAEAQSRRASLEADLKVAQKAEDLARASLKASTQKVHYTAAIRDVDARERAKAEVVRPLKEVTARQEAVEADITRCQARREAVQAEFEGLEVVFLSEHANQVEARARLEARRRELEAGMDRQFVVRFDRLREARQGRAVVPVDGESCSGCRTRLRKPFLSQLRDEGVLACENCMRLLHLPRP